MLNDPSLQYFSKQLLSIVNGRDSVDKWSGFISYPLNIRNYVSLKYELINKVFLNIIANYKSTEWLNKRTILVTKNKEVDNLNFVGTVSTAFIQIY